MTDDLDPAERGRIGILICDDNAAMRDVLTSVIEFEPRLRVVGYACDGNEAIAKATLLQPQVIILDLAMPTRNGLDALPELAVVAPNAKTVVLSAYSAPSVISEAMRRGAVRYIEKGASVDDLLDAIDSAAEIPSTQPSAVA